MEYMWISRVEVCSEVFPEVRLNTIFKCVNLDQRVLDSPPLFILSLCVCGKKVVLISLLPQTSQVIDLM